MGLQYLSDSFGGFIMAQRVYVIILFGDIDRLNIWSLEFENYFV